MARWIWATISLKQIVLLIAVNAAKVVTTAVFVLMIVLTIENGETFSIYFFCFPSKISNINIHGNGSRKKIKLQTFSLLS